MNKCLDETSTNVLVECEVYLWVGQGRVQRAPIAGARFSSFSNRHSIRYYTSYIQGLLSSPRTQGPINKLVGLQFFSLKFGSNTLFVIVTYRDGLYQQRWGTLYWRRITQHTASSRWTSSRSKRHRKSPGSRWLPHRPLASPGYTWWKRAARPGRCCYGWATKAEHKLLA